MNLAARLCGSTADGEILVDSRTFEVVRDRVRAEGRQLELRDFARPVMVQNVTSRST